MKPAWYSGHLRKQPHRRLSPRLHARRTTCMAVGREQSHGLPTFGHPLNSRARLSHSSWSSSASWSAGSTLEYSCCFFLPQHRKPMRCCRLLGVSSRQTGDGRGGGRWAGCAAPGRTAEPDGEIPVYRAYSIIISRHTRVLVRTF